MSDMFKDAQFNIRVSAETMKELQAAADALGQTASGLTRMLLERYTAARREHGDHMVWPPRFAHFVPEARPRDDQIDPSGGPAPQIASGCNNRPTAAQPRATAAGAAPPARVRTSGSRPTPKEA